MNTSDPWNTSDPRAASPSADAECAAMRERLSARHDDPLDHRDVPGVERAESLLDAHLAACEACRRFARELEELSAAFSPLRSYEPPPALARSLRARAEATRTVHRRRAGRIWLARAAAALIGFLAVAAVERAGFLAVPGAGARPRPDDARPEDTGRALELLAQAGRGLRARSDLEFLAAHELLAVHGHTSPPGVGGRGDTR